MTIPNQLRQVPGTSHQARARRRKTAHRFVILPVVIGSLLLGAIALGIGMWPSSGSTDAEPSCPAGSIALTFDDGPDDHTPQVLDLLARYGAKATFFVLGEKAAKHPELIRRAVAEGHRVENHSWSHAHLEQLTEAEAREELSSTTASIMAAGAPAPVFVRAPYGGTNPTVLQQIAELRLKVIRWTIDTKDWRGANPTEITTAVLEHLAPDAVVLMHDGLRHTPNTLEALPGIIAGVRAAGYCTGFPQ